MDSMMEINWGLLTEINWVILREKEIQIRLPKGLSSEIRLETNLVIQTETMMGIVMAMGFHLVKQTETTREIEMTI